MILDSLELLELQEQLGHQETGVLKVRVDHLEQLEHPVHRETRD